MNLLREMKDIRYSPVIYLHLDYRTPLRLIDVTITGREPTGSYIKIYPSRLLPWQLFVLTRTDAHFLCLHNKVNLKILRPLSEWINSRLLVEQDVEKIIPDIEATVKICNRLSVREATSFLCDQTDYTLLYMLVDQFLKAHNIPFEEKKNESSRNLLYM